MTVKTLELLSSDCSLLQWPLGTPVKARRPPSCFLPFREENGRLKIHEWHFPGCPAEHREGPPASFLPNPLHLPRHTLKSKASPGAKVEAGCKRAGVQRAGGVGGDFVLY